MLGLDTGWNCHISLSCRVNTSNPSNLLKAHNSGTTLNSPDIISNDFNEKSSSFLESSADKAKLIQPRTSRTTKREPRFLRLNTRTRKSTNLNKANSSINEMKKYSSRSMPSLKLTKYTTSKETDGSTQIVKFNLVNVKSGYKKKSGPSAAAASNSANYFKKRKLAKMNSVDGSSMSISSTSYDENSDSESTAHNNLIKTTKRMLSGGPKSSANYRTSESSLKSNSVSKSVPKMFSKRKNSLHYSKHQQQQQMEREEDSASSRTNHSGRTLSETEILGNAVSLFLILNSKL